jgi:hypothetical protein
MCKRYDETCSCPWCEQDRREMQTGPSSQAQSVVVYAREWRDSGDPLALLNARFWAAAVISGTY